MVTSMLEKAIEIEGLLRIIRDGNPLPETYILLNLKTAELAEQAESLEEKTKVTQPEAPHADFVMAAPAPPAAPMPEVDFSVHESAQEDSSLARTIEALSDLGEDDPYMTPEDLALIEEDDILLSFEDTMEFPQPASNNRNDVTVADSAEKEATDGISTTEDIAPEEEEKPTLKNEKSPVTSEKEQPAPTTAKEHERPEATADAKTVTQQPKRQTKLRSAFSLNDRFLYARELFNGNMKMFDSTLDFLEGIEDYSIIEDYFYSELEWNPENCHVATFMDILRPHFKE